MRLAARENPQTYPQARLGRELGAVTCFIIGYRFNRDPADDFRAAAFSGANTDIAAMQLHEVFHKRQAKPGPALIR